MFDNITVVLDFLEARKPGKFQSRYHELVKFLSIPEISFIHVAGP